MAQQINKKETEPRYYKPPLARSMLHRIQRLYNDFPEIAEKYDSNPVKFIERALYNLIDEEEQKQLAKKDHFG